MVNATRQSCRVTMIVVKISPRDNRSGRHNNLIEVAAIKVWILGVKSTAAMPMGYRSLVGDMGSSLSGGQKQRVVLARALYRAPTLLVLDEATSHLDVARERQVADAIAHLAITRIIIAHRPETIAAADAICLLTGATTRLLDREAFWRPRSGDADATTAYRGSSENEDFEHA
ncbi:MAG: hypothetical protein B7Z57_11805 [Acidiphilium sp. 37-60-79]|nr:MAG: hypothetical protein B7Z57_11805 [Acidiphilium sp. 37-60-79]